MGLAPRGVFKVELQDCDLVGKKFVFLRLVVGEDESGAPHDYIRKTGIHVAKV